MDLDENHSSKTDWGRLTQALMQKNLSSLKHLRLGLSDADSYHRDGDTDEKIILVRKESFRSENF